MQDIETSRWVGTEMIGEREMHVIDVTSKDDRRIRLWIGKQDFLIHKAFSDYRAALPAGAEASGTESEFIAETHKYILINNKLPDTDFNFAPSPGDRLAEGRKAPAAPASAYAEEGTGA